MKIINPLTGTPQPIQTALRIIASQENCDGSPYDQMCEAADYIEHLESQLAQREWISVEDRLPEESTNVCGYSEEYGWISWVYYWDEGFWDEGERPVRVDYWMDIRPPAPPKEADND